MSAARKPQSSVRKSSPWIRRAVVAAVLLALAGGGYYYYRQRNAEAEAAAYRTAKVERGDIRVAISATGALAAISTVDVGSQISGQVTDVLVDFNDRVTKGQVIAKIDPSTYQAQIAQGSAQVNSARAGLATAQATLRNAELDFQRKSALVERQLVARSDADLARAARDQARAQVAAAQAQINQQIASTQTSRLNLERTVIRAPVDGVVLTRTVEPGQTVAASLQSPVLFQIAEDLSKMEIVLAIDEADIGQVKAGQSVSFTVDSFPDRQFRGKVQQVRISATNTSNVITYPVVVSVDNAEQSLLPGMTANAEIEVSRRDDVLRVSNAALRYKPAEEDAGAQAQAGPGGPGGQGGGARGGMATDLPRVAQQLKLSPQQQVVFDAALEAMKQRSAARQATPAANGGGSALFGGGRGPGGPGGGIVIRSGGGSAGAAMGALRQRMQERFNQQFAEFRAALDPQQQARWDSEIAALLNARRAPLYKLVNGKPEQVMVRVGASDGSWTEVSGNIQQGDEVVVGSGRSAK
ncbi:MULTISPECIES: efflux RND transporter periplasmic adaptor subunit [unclassified Lysobacter]|uniref:efflux RND transporter periplasmic adaptor subunit n=1 Tax=unclassified Lysobacter TaxID=2635362 RepID=UPI0006F5A0BB|nr:MULTISPECIES: efflux RND transporter periplasmic adaptor subunit [unclassified Lysobacter]KQZ66615.1 RND transporter [Lysobacter sp. Root559]KRC32767.1 RND transporter [Lysobacter sp. Root76]KRD67889.1 RND transporter [Lysobacter sp. Root96]